MDGWSITDRRSTLRHSMSTLFKDLFSDDFYDSLSGVLIDVIPNFNRKEFTSRIFCEEFEGYELKQRITHTTKVLHQFMPEQFDEAVEYLLTLVKRLESADIKPDSLEYLFLAEYIERYGINDYNKAIAAFEVVTPFITCEFAVRPFIVKYEREMLAQMTLWASHQNRRVRRLASEGARPRLPWGMALSSLKQDPSPLLPILLLLKGDECEAVRRSVANSLNDIAKDNPHFVIQFAKTHYGQSDNTNRLIKHACRTLLKNADPDVLQLFGFDSRGIYMSAFDIKNPKVKVGTDLNFSFCVHNQNDEPKKLRLEYAVYYKKQNGSLSRKVFKISEREIEANSQYLVERKQSFKIITTRKFHLGGHQLSIILNGLELAKKEFELI
ncbi:DNA alkylation repair protein [Photobacterium minamisatsumaniensis]|uniref:DNA alkylation repair protein n=1 Tax=Photobacterium minamisatsumaniensis TaxID=2910233 RepID=UPI003D1060E7